ncbi:MAG: hypothetical protein HXX18_11250 [Bacteroidetes bacterium]|nr:hypothetical protein [Bacteroidota bacterium]
MKNLLFIICICISLNVLAQEIPIISIKSTNILINTVKENSIEIKLEVDLSKDYLGYEIDDESFAKLNTNLNAKLISKKCNTFLNKGEKVEVNISKKEIVFTVKNVSDELIKLLNDSIADIYIKTNKDIYFNIIKGDSVTAIKTLKIDLNQIQKSTRSQIFLTESMTKELINAKGGNVFLSQNQFNFGVIPSENSSSNKTEYQVSFKYRKQYSFYNNLPVFFYTEGTISTNSRDSLNYLSVYPLNINFIKCDQGVIGQIGIEGNQVFTNYRISGNFYWNGIMPNIIDLSYGEDRLRLKPVIKVGLKLYKEVQNNRTVELNSKEFSNQIYCEYYYDIPIQKIYSLRLEGAAFYDFNLKANPDKKAMFNYSIIFGIDIPKTDFKTIFKYVKGTNGISYEKNDYLMIGFMMDLLSTKQK